MSYSSRIGSPARLVFLLLSALVLPIGLPSQDREGTERYVISGRVVDPDGLRPEGAVLMLGSGENGSFNTVPVPTEKDGSFVTSRLSPGTYVLEIIRTAHSPTKPAIPVGLSIVGVSTGDVSGVTVEVRRDTSLTGRFRMESDNPDAAWPPHIVVLATLAVDGAPFLGSAGAEGASGGRFVLRNAFGPRVVRCGYTLAPGSRWWPSRVMLDGVDITNVPTDFSAHENGQLEVVFTQHPSRIAGTVTDAQGRPVRAPWVLVWSADPALWQQWATTTTVAQGDTEGRFALPVAPGGYLARAVPHGTFDQWVSANRQIHRLASGGVHVEVEERGTSRIALALQER